jgi:hypothetical protein
LAASSLQDDYDLWQVKAALGPTLASIPTFKGVWRSINDHRKRPACGMP